MLREDRTETDGLGGSVIRSNKVSDRHCDAKAGSSSDLITTMSEAASRLGPTAAVGYPMPTERSLEDIGDDLQFIARMRE